MANENIGVSARGVSRSSVRTPTISATTETPTRRVSRPMSASKTAKVQQQQKQIAAESEFQEAVKTTEDLVESGYFDDIKSVEDYKEKYEKAPEVSKPFLVTPQSVEDTQQTKLTELQTKIDEKIATNEYYKQEAIDKFKRQEQRYDERVDELEKRHRQGKYSDETYEKYLARAKIAIREDEDDMEEKVDYREAYNQKLKEAKSKINVNVTPEWNDIKQDAYTYADYVRTKQQYRNELSQARYEEKVNVEKFLNIGDTKALNKYLGGNASQSTIDFLQERGYTGKPLEVGRVTNIQNPTEEQKKYQNIRVGKQTYSLYNPTTGDLVTVKTTTAPKFDMKAPQSAFVGQVTTPVSIGSGVYNFANRAVLTDTGVDNMYQDQTGKYIPKSQVNVTDPYSTKITGLQKVEGKVELPKVIARGEMRSTDVVQTPQMLQELGYKELPELSEDQVIVSREEDVYIDPETKEYKLETGQVIGKELTEEEMLQKQKEEEKDKRFEEYKNKILSGDDTGLDKFSDVTEGAFETVLPGDVLVDKEDVKPEMSIMDIASIEKQKVQDTNEGDPNFFSRMLDTWNPYEKTSLVRKTADTWNPYDETSITRKVVAPVLIAPFDALGDITGLKDYYARNPEQAARVRSAANPINFWADETGLKDYYAENPEQAARVRSAMNPINFWADETGLKQYFKDNPEANALGPEFRQRAASGAAAGVDLGIKYVAKPLVGATMAVGKVPYDAGKAFFTEAVPTVAGAAYVGGKYVVDKFGVPIAQRASSGARAGLDAGAKYIGQPLISGSRGAAELYYENVLKPQARVLAGGAKVTAGGTKFVLDTGAEYIGQPILDAAGTYGPDIIKRNVETTVTGAKIIGGVTKETLDTGAEYIGEPIIDITGASLDTGAKYIGQPILDTAGWYGENILKPQVDRKIGQAKFVAGAIGYGGYEVAKRASSGASGFLKLSGDYVEQGAIESDIGSRYIAGKESARKQRKIREESDRLFGGEEYENFKLIVNAANSAADVAVSEGLDTEGIQAAVTGSIIEQGMTREEFDTQAEEYEFFQRMQDEKTTPKKEFYARAEAGEYSPIMQTAGDIYYAGRPVAPAVVGGILTLTPAAPIGYGMLAGYGVMEIGQGLEKVTDPDRSVSTTFSGGLEIGSGALLLAGPVLKLAGTGVKALGFGGKAAVAAKTADTTTKLAKTSSPYLSRSVGFTKALKYGVPAGTLTGGVIGYTTYKETGDIGRSLRAGVVSGLIVGGAYTTASYAKLIGVGKAYDERILKANQDFATKKYQDAYAQNKAFVGYETRVKQVGFFKDKVKYTSASPGSGRNVKKYADLLVRDVGYTPKAAKRLLTTYYEPYQYKSVTDPRAKDLLTPLKAPNVEITKYSSRLEDLGKPGTPDLKGYETTLSQYRVIPNVEIPTNIKEFVIGVDKIPKSLLKANTFTPVIDKVTELSFRPFGGKGMVDVVGGGKLSMEGDKVYSIATKQPKYYNIKVTDQNAKDVIAAIQKDSGGGLLTGKYKQGFMYSTTGDDGYVKSIELISKSRYPGQYKYAITSGSYKTVYDPAASQYVSGKLSGVGKSSNVGTKIRTVSDAAGKGDVDASLYTVKGQTQVTDPFFSKIKNEDITKFLTSDKKYITGTPYKYEGVQITTGQYERLADGTVRYIDTNPLIADPDDLKGIGDTLFRRSTASGGYTQKITDLRIFTDDELANLGLGGSGSSGSPGFGGALYKKSTIPASTRKLMNARSKKAEAELAERAISPREALKKDGNVIDDIIGKISKMDKKGTLLGVNRPLSTTPTRMDVVKGDTVLDDITKQLTDSQVDDVVSRQGSQQQLLLRRPEQPESFIRAPGLDSKNKLLRTPFIPKLFSGSPGQVQPLPLLSPQPTVLTPNISQSLVPLIAQIGIGSSQILRLDQKADYVQKNDFIVDSMLDINQKMDVQTRQDSQTKQDTVQEVVEVIETVNRTPTTPTTPPTPTPTPRPPSPRPNQPRPPRIPRTVPLIPLFPWFDGESKKGKKKKDKKKNIFALTPDFTARALGISPQQLKEESAIKEAKKVKTGAEIRTGVEIVDQLDRF